MRWLSAYSWISRSIRIPPRFGLSAIIALAIIALFSVSLIRFLSNSNLRDSHLKPKRLPQQWRLSKVPPQAARLHRWSFCLWRWALVTINMGAYSVPSDSPFVSLLLARTHSHMSEYPLQKFSYLIARLLYFRKTICVEFIFVCNRQDITAAAMRACRDAISSNSIPAFRRGIPSWGCVRELYGCGVGFDRFGVLMWLELSW